MTDPAKDAERLSRIRELTEADDGSRNFTAGTMLFVLRYLDAEITRLTQERDEARKAERNLSDAYVRLRSLIPGAFDTPHAPSHEQVWDATEAALRNLVGAYPAPTPERLALGWCPECGMYNRVGRCVHGYGPVSAAQLRAGREGVSDRCPLHGSFVLETDGTRHCNFEGCDWSTSTHAPTEPSKELDEAVIASGR